MHHNFKKGDRVRWTGKSPLGSRGKTFADNEPEKVGRLGTIEDLIGTRTARIAFDNGQISTGTFFANLELVETNTMTTIANFKSRVKLALDSLLSPNSDESAKDQAVRRLGIASALASRADSEKKAAKTKLKELGVIRDDYAASTTETIFDSERYMVDAVTNAGSQRLDAAALEAALLAEGVSFTKRTRIIRAAMKDIKPSTSFKVEAK